MIIADEEVFFIEYDDKRQILYAPLRSYLALAQNKTIDLIRSQASSDIKRRFFEKLKKRPLLNIQEIIGNLHRANPELSLAITDNCNLRCVYCHAAAGEDHKRRSMSTEMIDSLLEKYFNHITPEKTVKISFNEGGEPTYKFNKLVYAVNKAKELASERNARCHFSMATNGCYGDNVREFIVNEFSQISLSFDGPDYIHDRHRPTSNGKSSFPMVFATAQYFYQSDLTFAFRATMSDFSMEHLEDIVNFFAENFPGKSIGLEHLNPFGRGKYCKAVLPPNKESFTNKLVKLLKYVRNKPITILNSASTEYDIVRPVFCSNVGTPNWTVNVDGNITACSRDNAPDEFIFGKYDLQNQKLIFDENKLKKLREMVVSNYDECNECFCKYHCAGDCPDRRLTDKLNCDSIRNIGFYILKSKLNNVEVQHAYTISSPSVKQ